MRLSVKGSLCITANKGQFYCCFAVRDAEGGLKCLDNHQVDGPEKFVLGRKSIYTRDWEVLWRAEQVFVCEGIIDYLSVKTMEGDDLAGLALLGNQLIFDPELLGNARVLISALDHDRGGYGAFYELGEQYPDKSIEPYDLEGRKDPNELLVAIKEGKGRRLSAEKKLKLYQDFIQCDNKAELARKWGLDRSYMYEIVRECEKSLLDTFEGRKPGRKPNGKPATLEEAWERIKELEEQYEQEATEKERLYCQSEFLKLRLQWSETEAAELRGEVVDDSTGLVKKKQIKKRKEAGHSVSGSDEGDLQSINTRAGYGPDGFLPQPALPVASRDQGQKRAGEQADLRADSSKHGKGDHDLSSYGRTEGSGLHDLPSPWIYLHERL